MSECKECERLRGLLQRHHELRGKPAREEWVDGGPTYRLAMQLWRDTAAALTGHVAPTIDRSGSHSAHSAADRKPDERLSATGQPSAAPHDNKANVSVRCPDCDDGAYKGTDRICLTCNGLGELRRATSPTPAPQPDPVLQEIAMRALASGPTITLTLDEVRALYKFLPGAPGCIAQEASP